MKAKIGDTVQFKKSDITGTVEKILRGTYVVKTPTSKLTAWPEDLIIVGLSEVSLEKEMVSLEVEFSNFVSLVKRMREAQRELDTCSIGDYGFRQHCASQLESEVDEYLKKMEI